MRPALPSSTIRCGGSSSVITLSAHMRAEREVAAVSRRGTAPQPTPRDSSRSSRKSLQVVVGELGVVGDVGQVVEDPLARSVDDRVTVTGAWRGDDMYAATAAASSGVRA